MAGLFNALAAASVAAICTSTSFQTWLRRGPPTSRLILTRRYGKATGSLEQDVSTLSIDDQWQHMLKNKQLWIDHREAKSNGTVPKTAPDFLHTDSGTRLQLDDRTPSWARKDLIDAKLAPKATEMWAEVVKFPHQWSDFRESKANGWLKDTVPDFRHVSDSVRALCINEKDFEQMPGLKEKLDKLEGKFAPVTQGMGVLAHMRNNSLDWSDFREAKQRGWVGENHPDFVHLRSSVQIWTAQADLEDNWESRTRYLRFAPPNKGRAAIYHMIEHPSEWIDQRDAKERSLISSKAPTFRHLETSMGVWMKVPKDLAEQLNKVTLTKYDNPWRELLTNKKDWRDFRKGKAAGEYSANHPDFRNLKTDLALWVDSSTTPPWAKERLKRNDFRPPRMDTDELLKKLGLSGVSRR